MKPFGTLLALGLACGAAAANLTCVKTPAEFVANLETIKYHRKRLQETKDVEEATETHEVSDEAQAKILREVRIAAGRLGRLTLWGADMWIKDQYVDIFCRWVYLPLYAILAAISLNEST